MGFKMKSFLRQEYGVFAHGVQKIGHFVIVVHDIRSDSPSVDGVDPVSVCGVQDAVFIFERADVADLTVDPFVLKTAGELLKFPQSRIFKEINERDIRVAFFLRTGVVQGEESLHPCIKQFKGAQVVFADDGLVGGIMDESLSQFVVSDHGSGAVGIDLAELEFACIFMIEQVKTRNREKSLIGGGEKDQVFQFF